MSLLKTLEEERIAAASRRPSREEAEAAVQTLIRWAGDDPNREGLIGTPDRVVRAYEEFFAGYDEDPAAILSRTFEEADGYDEMVTLTHIRLESHCEHHMVPIIGKAHIAYISSGKVIGLSKLNRIVQYFAKRPQVQERLTNQIGEELKSILGTDDIAVVIDAKHLCVSSRGIKDESSATVTSFYSGAFNSPAKLTEFNNYLK